MSDVTVVQVKLLNINHTGEQLTTWVDRKPGLKVGSRIKLKDFKPEDQWDVIELWDMERKAKDFDWHRKWTNNI